MILSLSVIILLHEMGHFLPAKWFKCRVEKFMLFFDAGFSLFRRKIGETVYGLGWIPLGGYVKISGMIDESLDKEQLKLPPQPYEFRSKPAWQRLIIMIGGVTMNALLAFVLFAIILQVWGESTLPPKAEIYGLYADSLAREIGLRDGDVITAMDGKPVTNEFSVPVDIFTREVKVLTVDRDGRELSLRLPDTFIGQLSHNRLENFIEIRIPTIVDSVLAGKVHMVSGVLHKGDRVISLNGESTPTFTDLGKLEQHHKGDTIDLGIIRAGDTVQVRAKEDTGGIVGFRPVAEYDKLLPVVTHKFGFWESFPAGVRKSADVMKSYLAQIRVILFNRNVKTRDTLGSVVSMGEAYSGTWDWESTWKLTAFLSVILGFMNILPIPALDGGHILFLLVEIISGRKPGDKFMEYAQIGGMILLFGLMAYALGLDFFHVFHKG